MYILSYCPYQKSYHIEEEKLFWEMTFQVFKRSKFDGCAYVPIRKFNSYGEYASWFSKNIGE